MKKKPTASTLDRDFAPAVWRRAKGLAEEYSVVVSAAEGRWLAKCVEIPTAFAFADSAEQAILKVREPLSVLLATMIELERPLPSRMSEGKRDSQVNVKLTAEERLLFEGASRKRGFKGLSDFFRFAALQMARN